MNAVVFQFNRSSSFFVIIASIVIFVVVGLIALLSAGFGTVLLVFGAAYALSAPYLVISSIVKLIMRPAESVIVSGDGIVSNQTCRGRKAKLIRWDEVQDLSIEKETEDNISFVIKFRRNNVSKTIQISSVEIKETKDVFKHEILKYYTNSMCNYSSMRRKRTSQAAL